MHGLQTRTHDRMAVALTAVTLATFALAGCVGAQAVGTVNLYVKDALTDDVAEVHAVFTGAAIIDDEGAHTTVFSGEESIELLSLNASDAKALLAGFSIPAGNYSQLQLTIGNVTVVDHDGNTTELLLLGDVITVAQNFTVIEGEELDIVVDFGLESSIDLGEGTFTPFVADVQTSADDTDGDGVNDVDDTDDDGDGIEDADDDDRDGDNQTDAPQQSHRLSEHAIGGLCTAWRNSEMGRLHGDAANSTAFRALANKSAEAGAESIDLYCEDKRPGRSGQAGPPDGVPRGAPNGTPGGPPDWVTRGGDGNGTDGNGTEDAGRPEGAGRPDGAGSPNGTAGGNQTADGNETSDG